MFPMCIIGSAYGYALAALFSAGPRHSRGLWLDPVLANLFSFEAVYRNARITEPKAARFHITVGRFRAS
jgi:hypothetical protein